MPWTKRSTNACGTVCRRHTHCPAHTLSHVKGKLKTNPFRAPNPTFSALLFCRHRCFVFLINFLYFFCIFLMFLGTIRHDNVVLIYITLQPQRTLRSSSKDLLIVPTLKTVLGSHRFLWLQHLGLYSTPQSLVATHLHNNCSSFYLPRRGWKPGSSLSAPGIKPGPLAHMSEHVSERLTL